MKKITLENGKEIKISDESYKALAESITKEILVPENIKIERLCGDGDTLGILFNNEKQVMYSLNGNYSVVNTDDSFFTKCKLVPVEEEDLKVGYTYFRCNIVNPEFTNLYHYCKYLGEEYVYISEDRSVGVGCSK